MSRRTCPAGMAGVIRALDHLLRSVHGEAAVGRGWAVWRHGFIGRVTQDVDIVLPAGGIDEFLRAASVSGFEVLPQPPGRWPKLVHKESGVRVDILPQGERPGMPARPAPTTLPHPASLGAQGEALRSITLPSLVHLKLAAGRLKNDADVAELIRANPRQIDAARAHLASVHPDYVFAFDHLVKRPGEQEDQ